MSLLDINDISKEILYKNLIARFLQDDPNRMHGASTEELKVVFVNKNGQYKPYDETIPEIHYRLYLAYSGALVYALMTCEGMNDEIPLKNHNGFIEYAGVFPHVELYNNELKHITLLDILNYESIRSF